MTERRLAKMVVHRHAYTVDTDGLVQDGTGL
jgi:hypothetical protein